MVFFSFVDWQPFVYESLSRMDRTEYRRLLFEVRLLLECCTLESNRWQFKFGLLQFESNFLLGSG